MELLEELEQPEPPPEQPVKKRRTTSPEAPLRGDGESLDDDYDDESEEEYIDTKRQANKSSKSRSKKASGKRMNGGVKINGSSKRTATNPQKGSKKVASTEDSEEDVAVVRKPQRKKSVKGEKSNVVDQIDLTGTPESAKKRRKGAQGKKAAKIEYVDVESEEQDNGVEKKPKKRSRTKKTGDGPGVASQDVGEVRVDAGLPVVLTPLSPIWTAKVSNGETSEGDASSLAFKQDFVWDVTVFSEKKATMADDTAISDRVDVSNNSAAGGESTASNSRERPLGKRQMRSVQQANIRQNLMFGNLDPHTMVQCEQYRSTDESEVLNSRSRGSPSVPPPFTVIVHPDATFVCDLHAHLATCEIIGFLGGKWDESTKTLYIQAAFPCRSLMIDGDDGSTDVEMDPGSEIELREIINNAELEVVGWYHSHPAFAPDPSVRDIENQTSYQQLFQRQCSSSLPDEKPHVSEPFVGLIVGTYDTRRDTPVSLFRYFNVRSEKVSSGTQHEIYMPYEVIPARRHFRRVLAYEANERMRQLPVYPEVLKALKMPQDFRSLSSLEVKEPKLEDAKKHVTDVVKSPPRRRKPSAPVRKRKPSTEDCAFDAPAKKGRRDRTKKRGQLVNGTALDNEIDLTGEDGNLAEARISIDDHLPKYDALDVSGNDHIKGETGERPGDGNQVGAGVIDIDGVVPPSTTASAKADNRDGVVAKSAIGRDVRKQVVANGIDREDASTDSSAPRTDSGNSGVAPRSLIAANHDGSLNGELSAMSATSEPSTDKPASVDANAVTDNDVMESGQSNGDVKSLDTHEVKVQIGGAEIVDLVDDGMADKMAGSGRESVTPDITANGSTASPVSFTPNGPTGRRKKSRKPIRTSKNRRSEASSQSAGEWISPQLSMQTVTRYDYMKTFDSVGLHISYGESRNVSPVAALMKPKTSPESIAEPDKDPQYIFIGGSEPAMADTEKKESVVAPAPVVPAESGPIDEEIEFIAVDEAIEGSSQDRDAELEMNETSQSTPTQSTDHTEDKSITAVVVPSNNDIDTTRLVRDCLENVVDLVAHSAATSIPKSDMVKKEDSQGANILGLLTIDSDSSAIHNSKDQFDVEMGNAGDVEMEQVDVNAGMYASAESVADRDDVLKPDVDVPMVDSASVNEERVLKMEPNDGDQSLPNGSELSRIEDPIASSKMNDPTDSFATAELNRSTDEAHAATVKLEVKSDVSAPTPLEPKLFGNLRESEDIRTSLANMETLRQTMTSVPRMPSASGQQEAPLSTAPLSETTGGVVNNIDLPIERLARHLESLRGRYGKGMFGCVEQVVTLVDYYRDFDRRIDLNEPWKFKLNKLKKIEASLSEYVRYLNLPVDLRREFVKDLIGYLELSWEVTRK